MYGTSKAAILGLTRNIAAQHGKQGIRCVSISPGVIITPVTEASLSSDEIARSLAHHLTTRMGRPEDVANAVAFMASDAAGFITGVDLQVAGGLFSHVPNYAETQDDFN